MILGSENQATEEKPAQCHSVQATVLLAYLPFCVGYGLCRILKISCFLNNFTPFTFIRLAFPIAGIRFSKSG
jgi:hypothetical protein